MDVLTLDSCELDINHDDTCRVQLVEYLGAKRFKKANQLHRVVMQKRRKLRRLLKFTLKQVETSASREQKQKHSGDLNVISNDGRPSTHAMSLALDLASQLGATPVLNRGNQLKRTQDAVGEWHDWVVLGEIATDILRHPNCKLIAVIRARSEAKYDAALQLAEQVRARLREPEHKTGMAASKKQPRSPRVSRPLSIAASPLAA